MDRSRESRSAPVVRLEDAVRISGAKLINPEAAGFHGGIRADAEVLLVLAAGKGTRFGSDPKCIQPVHGAPLARHSIDAFRRFSPSPVVCMVGYRWQEVARALGADNLHVRSDNPAGGTAFAAYEAFSVPGLLEANPLLVITMGDRVVPPSVFRRLCGTHREGDREADLTFLTAEYEPPRNRGRGRVIRDGGGRVVRIIEERDILALPDGGGRQALLDLTEGNCPLYAVRAATLMRYLQDLSCDNAQGQFYLTDIVEAISRDGGEIRTVTTTPADPEYDLLVLRRDPGDGPGAARGPALDLGRAAFRRRAGSGSRCGRDSSRPSARAGGLHRAAARGDDRHGRRGASVPVRPAGGDRHLGGAPAHRVHASRHDAVLRPGLADADRCGRRERERADRDAGPGGGEPADPPAADEPDVPGERELRSFG